VQAIGEPGLESRVLHELLHGLDIGWTFRSAVSGINQSLPLIIAVCLLIERESSNNTQDDSITDLLIQLDLFHVVFSWRIEDFATFNLDLRVLF
jgi:hypothetical protein